jgi:hypothetical protein
LIYGIWPSTQQYNIRIDLRGIGRGGAEWIDLAQDRDQRRTLMNTVMNLRVAQNTEKVLIYRAACGFSRPTQLFNILYSRPYGRNIVCVLTY